MLRKYTGRVDKSTTFLTYLKAAVYRLSLNVRRGNTRCDRRHRAEELDDELLFLAEPESRGPESCAELGLQLDRLVTLVGPDIDVTRLTEMMCDGRSLPNALAALEPRACAARTRAAAWYRGHKRERDDKGII